MRFRAAIHYSALCAVLCSGAWFFVDTFHDLLTCVVHVFATISISIVNADIIIWYIMVIMLPSFAPLPPQRDVVPDIRHVEPTDRAIVVASSQIGWPLLHTALDVIAAETMMLMHIQSTASELMPEWCVVDVHRVCCIINSLSKQRTCAALCSDSHAIPRRSHTHTHTFLRHTLVLKEMFTILYPKHAPQKCTAQHSAAATERVRVPHNRIIISHTAVAARVRSTRRISEYSISRRQYQPCA